LSVVLQLQNCRILHRVVILIVLYVRVKVFIVVLSAKGRNRRWNVVAIVTEEGFLFVTIVRGRDVKRRLFVVIVRGLVVKRRLFAVIAGGAVIKKLFAAVVMGPVKGSVRGVMGWEL
jgi:hypothetical protein